MASTLLESTDRGLLCRPGDFFIDPWRPVDRAVITHAHSDHARFGSKAYLTVRDGAGLLRARLGDDIKLDTLEYGEACNIHGVHLSFHPAGHVLGSSQVRLEYDGEVAVSSGDYKLEADETCRSFEPIRCHTFLTESTFGLPIYRWETPQRIFEQINFWWRANRDEGKASILYAYALGKAQRILRGVDDSIGPIYTHGAVERMTRVYRQCGVVLPPTTPVGETVKGQRWAGALIIAPPSADGTPWARRFEPASSTMASGWMAVRGQRRRRAFDRGFVLSDHADWTGLNSAIAATRAENVWVTHGSSAILARYLSARGLNARTIATQFEGEAEEPSPAALSDGELTPAAFAGD